MSYKARRDACNIFFGVIGIALIAHSLRHAMDNGSRWGGDFRQLYVAAKLVLQGRNVYDSGELHAGFLRYTGALPRWPLFYPPSTDIVVIPLSILSYSAARAVWFGILLCVMVIGLWRLLAEFAPGWGPARSLLTIGLVMHCDSMHWALMLLQPIALIIGILALFVTALARGNHAAAYVLAAFVLCLKLTFALPFLGLLLLQRRYVPVLALLLFVFAVNAAGFARMGGMPAVAAYRQTMRKIELHGDINSLDARQREPASRLDWALLLNAIVCNEPLAHDLASLLTAAVCLWLIAEARRCKLLCRDVGTLCVFLAPFACLSLLSVYHQGYDAAILAVPVLVYTSERAGLRKTPGVTWFCLLALLCLFGTTGEAAVTRLLQRHVSAFLWETRVVPSLAVTLALIASLITLRSTIRIRLGKAVTRTEARPAEVHAL